MIDEEFRVRENLLHEVLSDPDYCIKYQAPPSFVNLQVALNRYCYLKYLDISDFI